MKMQTKEWTWPVTLAVTAAAISAGALQAGAQQPPANPPGVQVDTPKVQVQVQTPAAKPQATHQALAVRASEIQGMDVRNPAKEELGEVKDLVINVPQGRIEYAALSFGGFAGIGDKLFAVPWDAMKVQADTDGLHLIANLDEKKLETAPGFDKNHWPELADRQWHTTVRQFYRGEAPRDANQIAPQPADKEKPAADQSHAADMMMRCENLFGMQVRNSQGAELGDIHDLVIDLDSGKVRYAAISFGGFLGIGDKLFAIPWDLVRIDRQGEETYAIVDLPKQRLENAPGFDKDHWPDSADAAWHNDVDKYYQSERDAHKPQP